MTVSLTCARSQCASRGFYHITKGVLIRISLRTYSLEKYSLSLAVSSLLWFEHDVNQTQNQTVSGHALAAEVCAGLKCTAAELQSEVANNKSLIPRILSHFFNVISVR